MEAFVRFGKSAFERVSWVASAAGVFVTSERDSHYGFQTPSMTTEFLQALTTLSNFMRPNPQFGLYSWRDDLAKLKAIAMPSGSNKDVLTKAYDWLNDTDGPLEAVLGRMERPTNGDWREFNKEMTRAAIAKDRGGVWLITNPKQFCWNTCNLHLLGTLRPQMHVLEERLRARASDRTEEYIQHTLKVWGEADTKEEHDTIGRLWLRAVQLAAAIEMAEAEPRTDASTSWCRGVVVMNDGVVNANPGWGSPWTSGPPW